MWRCDTRHVTLRRLSRDTVIPLARRCDITHVTLWLRLRGRSHEYWSLHPNANFPTDDCFWHPQHHLSNYGYQRQKYMEDRIISMIRFRRTRIIYIQTERMECGVWSSDWTEVESRDRVVHSMTYRGPGSSHVHPKADRELYNHHHRNIVLYFTKPSFSWPLALPIPPHAHPGGCVFFHQSINIWNVILLI